MITSALPTINQRQTRGGARIASGRPLPAADKSQDRLVTLQAGFRQATHLLPRDRRHLPGGAIAAAPGLFIQAFDRSTGLRPHTFEHQPPVKLIAAAPSHLNRLSTPASSAGSINASKWRRELGNLIQGRGTLTQGGGYHD